MPPKNSDLVGRNPSGDGWTGKPPTRDAKSGVLHFADVPSFQPNMSPKEVLQSGSFGGGYFRPIYSAVLKQDCTGVWKELPAVWIEGLDVEQHLASETYRTAVNKYKVNCGVKESKADSFGLLAWEKMGWIVAQDPYGWFHWYCRFYQGRRSEDDARQVGRWEKAAGPNGRWRQNLIAKCLKANRSYDDAKVSPVVRQTLQHWGYCLTAADFDKGAEKVRKNGAAYVPREQLTKVMDGKKRAAEPAASPKKRAAGPAASPKKRAKRS
jgi:hypothetical protein